MIPNKLQLSCIDPQSWSSGPLEDTGKNKNNFGFKMALFRSKVKDKSFTPAI